MCPDLCNTHFFHSCFPKLYLWQSLPAGDPPQTTAFILKERVFNGREREREIGEREREMCT